MSKNDPWRDSAIPGERTQWPAPQMVEPGTVLFHEGSPATEVIWIVDGFVKLTARRTSLASDESADTAAVGLRGARMLLGPFTSKHPRVHMVGATTVARIRLYRFGVSEFRERLAQPEFRDCACDAMTRTLHADVQDETRGWLRDPEQRLLALLSTLAHGSDSAGDCVHVAVPRELGVDDLASLVGVVRAEMAQLLMHWTCRGMARLEQDGFTFSRAPAAAVPAAPAGMTHGGWPSESPRHVRDARVIRALALIDDAYAQDAFGIRELSRLVNLSPWHLSRLLKSATRMTFPQLRNAVRVERARVALLTTELSIKEIAAGVGYTHASDLTRHFRSSHRMSPIAYRLHARQASYSDPLSCRHAT